MTNEETLKLALQLAGEKLLENTSALRAMRSALCVSECNRLVEDTLAKYERVVKLETWLEHVLTYAQERYREQVGAILDDPHGYLNHGADRLDPTKTIADLRFLGVELGLDFDAMVASDGTNYEQARLRAIEQGKEG
jgi:hypothetical protein